MTSSRRTALSPRLVAVYISTLLTATAYGCLYLTPLAVEQLGGNELDVGAMLSLGTVSTLVVVTLSAWLVHRFGAPTLAGVGALFTAGALGVLGMTSSAGPTLLGVGLLAGAGWGLAYTAGPIVVSRHVDDTSRGQALSLLSAANVLGTATGALLYSLLGLTADWLPGLFMTASSLSCASALVFFLLHAFGYERTGETTVSGLAIRRVMASPARYPLVMVFLGACVFSSLMNFQTTYAADRGLDFGVYYGCYMLAVVGARLLAGGRLGQGQPLQPTPLLLIAMAACLIGLVFVTGPWGYGLAAAGLGLTYGLVYPLIKTEAVNCSHPELRASVLVCFSLCYFLGVYGFPIIASAVIVAAGYEGFLTLLAGLALLEGACGWAALADKGGATSRERPATPLRELGPPSSRAHGTSARGIELGDEPSSPPFQAAVFTVEAGCASAVDRHEVQECWLVATGRGLLHCEGQEHRLEPGQVVRFDPWQAHQVVNDGEQPLVLWSIWWGGRS